MTHLQSVPPASEANRRRSRRRQPIITQQQLARYRELTHVEGYLEVMADHVRLEGQRLIEELCRAQGCKVIDCLGRFVPTEMLTGYTLG